MTEAEKNEIVGLVMTEISSQAVDFDIATEQPQANDLLTAVRQTSSGEYMGVTLKWDDVARIATELANQAAKRAEQAETDANNILEQVQSKGTEITNFVATSKAELETQKNESVNAVKSVYQTDLNELKGDLNAESTARQTADNTLQQNIDSETTTRESEVAELERVNAIQKYEIENLKAKAEGKIYRTEIVDTEAYSLDVLSGVSPYAEVQKIGGKSIVWNQKVKNGNFSITDGWNRSYADISVSGNIATIKSTNNSQPIQIYHLLKIPEGHKVYMTAEYKFEKDISTGKAFVGFSTYGITTNYVANTWKRNSGIYTVKSDNTIEANIHILSGVLTTEEKMYARNFMTIDLTLMFGAGNEPTLEECQKIFSADYYPYDAGTLKSFPVKSVKSVKADGMEIGSIDLSSVTTGMKSAGSVADEWENGKKITRVGERAYTSGDESESNYITDGTTTYYPLATPTEKTVPEIDNYIQVEGGGTLTFESDETVQMPIPSTTRFVVDLT